METTITVRLPLRTSKRKEEKIEKVIEREQELAEFFSDRIVTFDRDKWSGDPTPGMRNLPEGRIGDEAKNGLYYAHYKDRLFDHISDIYINWQDDEYQNKRPDFSGMDYAILCNCSNDEIEFRKSDGIWGVKIPLLDEEDKKDWFRLRTGEYQENMLENAVSIGSTPRIVKKNGRYELHQPLIFEREGDLDYTPDTLIGVDMGLNNIATIVVLQDGEIQQVEFYDGAKIRHYRDKINEQRRKLQEAGRIDKVEELRNLERRFAKQQDHLVSRKIVEIAAEYPSPIIKVEELQGIRQRINEREYYRSSRRYLNNWTFRQLQDFIEYKAHLEGIKTGTVPAFNTSRSCYKCENDVKRPYKDNQELCYCDNCQEERNADFNGAVNIAQTNSS